MPLHICFFEDEKYKDFFPMTYLRPVYALRAGMVPLFRRAERYFDNPTIALLCRDQLAPTLAESCRDRPINIVKRGDDDLLLLNGRIRSYGDLPKLVGESRISTVFESNGETVAVLLKTDTVRDVPPVAAVREYRDRIVAERENIPDFDTSATLYNYCWEMMADIAGEVNADFRFFRPSLKDGENVRIHDGVFRVCEEDIHIGNDVEIFPGAMIDATKGPVYIGDNTKVESHTAIYGPTCIGPNSVVVAGRISASSIGHSCRVGGEVEHSIFHPYVNKYHAGFIGHSVVGSWVNFGAMTTNSDLKNNYSNVRITLNGRTIDSGSNKVGSLIGDHTKLGIGTLLNTGINIGVCCNIYRGLMITDKEVPSFSWGSTGNYAEYDIEKAIETARAVARRRNHELTKREISLLRVVHLGELTDDGVFSL